MRAPGPARAAQAAVHGTRPGRLRLAVAAIAFAVAAGAVVQLARVDADWGTAFGPDRQMRLLDATTTDYPGRVELARGILRQRPLDGRAFRALALQPGASGQGAGSGALLRIANARWPRDPVTLASLADRALAAGEIDAGLTHLDALLRVAPWVRAGLLPMLAPHLGDARLRAGLVQRLRRAPPWRGAFLGLLRADATPADDADRLLRALAGGRAPSWDVPEDAELLRTRVAVLDRQGRYAAARALWVSARPPTERTDAAVFDGGFEHFAPLGGYGWQVSAPPGVRVGTDASAPIAGSAALAIEFSGRAVRFAGLSQRLALAPGRRYALHAAWRDDTGASRPFAWRVDCAGEGGIALLPLSGGAGAAAGWHQTTMTFDVPATCRSQALHLVHTARSMDESRLQGTLFIDAVGIFPTR